jgi:DNA polymerase III epsilon subunit-like protein
MKFASHAEAFFWLGAASRADVAHLERPVIEDAEGTPHYIVYDTETNGGTGTMNMVIELGFVVFTRDHKRVFEFEQLYTLPRGHKINPFAQKAHGITLRKLQSEGVHPLDEQRGIHRFFEWVDKIHGEAGKVVAHNTPSDAKAMTNTARFHGMDREISADECFCTMRNSKNYCGLKDRRGAAKPPKNEELYERLFGSRPHWAGLHGALDDSYVTALSFREGVRVGLWR